MRTALTTLLFGATLLTSTKASDAGDIHKDFFRIAQDNGFDVRTHRVVTEDGYILSVFRLHPYDETPSAIHPPLFFQHGLLDSADAFITGVGELAPPFVAAREGYDVWLGNSRGNKYSKEHVKLDSKDPAFWEFDWEKMGDFDIPATIDYILSNTEFTRLTVIGHSQGTSQMFYALSHLEESLASKITLFIAMAPVTLMNHQTSPLVNFIARHLSLITKTARLLHINEFFPANYLTTGTFRLICGTIPDLCKLFESMLFTEDTSVDNTERFSVYMGHFPSGSSIKGMLHYAQIVNARQFQRYDFGVKENMRAYS